MEGQLQAQAALPPGKEPSVSIGQEAGWAPDPTSTTWKREKSCPYRDSNYDHSAVQAVASHYTHWAIPVNDAVGWQDE
jgi:L,D-peptidoglycan transpeptidase YkuD (ErfK/YbiS/YcfS/YnhG family)